MGAGQLGKMSHIVLDPVPMALSCRDAIATTLPLAMRVGTVLAQVHAMCHVFQSNAKVRGGGRLKSRAVHVQ